MNHRDEFCDPGEVFGSQINIDLIFDKLGDLRFAND